MDLILEICTAFGYPQSAGYRQKGFPRPQRSIRAKLGGMLNWVGTKYLWTEKRLSTFD